MTAACVHHRATGKSNLLAVAVKAADYLVGVARTRTRRARPQRRLPRALHGARRALPDDAQPRVSRTGPHSDRRPRPGRRGHRRQPGPHPVPPPDEGRGPRRPRQLPLRWRGRRLRRDRRPHPAGPAAGVWDDVVTRKMSITGGCGALFDGASPDGAKDQKSISRVHQAYGRDYQLPQSTAHNETCAAIGNVLWNWRMLQITGEARFADVLETGAATTPRLAGVSLDGTRFFYTNTLRQLDEMPAELRWSRQREPFISCFCCPPNLVRTIAEVGRLRLRPRRRTRSGSTSTAATRSTPTLDRRGPAPDSRRRPTTPGTGG